VLALEGIDAGYERTDVLRAVDLVVPPSTVVALLGANGAGKTTTLRVAAGLLRPRRGRVWMGGIDVTRRPAHRRAQLGVCLIPEGRGIFRSLTVRDNLQLQIPPWVSDGTIDAAVEAFPVLGHRLGQVAGSLSGGQQQMLALSRAFLARPKVVLLDEVSMGLAPIVVDEIFGALERLVSQGVSIILVEQYVRRALDMAGVAYLMARGSVVWSGPASRLDEEAASRAYLGHRSDPGHDGEPG
jgi:branched-chain amino acid transport system ATP-binding protein